MLVLTLFAYALIRTISVPLVHDEATSFLAYAQSGHFLPFDSMWDANNHYLSTVLGLLGYKFFGLHALALRWASVLAFVLFAWSAWRIGEHVRQRVVRWCLWSALLMCPMLFDLFSLYRGYGLAMAFFVFAVDSALRYIGHGERRNLLGALLAMGLANAALLALVPMWSVLLGVLLVAALSHECPRPAPSRWRTIAIWITLGLLPLLGAAGLSFILARFGLLFHGGTSGFIDVTVGSLARTVLGSGDAWVMIAAIAVVVLSTLVALAGSRSAGALTRPVFVVALLLWGEVLLRILLAQGFGINYAEDRTALHTLLLAIVLVAFAADELAERVRYGWAWALVLLALPVRSLLTMNICSTVLWPEQHVPERFVQHVRQVEHDLGRPAVVGAYRLSGLVWSLECRMHGTEGDVNALGWPSGSHDVRIIDQRFFDADMTGYAVVDSAPANGLRLLVREPPLRTTVLHDTTFSVASTTVERDTVMVLDAAALRDGELLIAVSGSLDSPAAMLDPRLCVVVFDASGRPVHNDLVMLATRRVQWHGETFQTIRLVPRLAHASRIEVSIWDPHRSGFALRNGLVIVRQVGR